MPQSSSVSLERKLAGDNRISVKNRVPAKVPLTEINEYLVCQLCFGYLIDATAITECQHTFCKSCILNYLERKNNYCPICEVQLNEAKPNLSLRSDDILQKLVYKLVPGLLVAEVHRRKEHIRKSDSIPPDGSLNGGGCGGIALLSADVKEAQDFCFLSPNDPVSLSLEYFKSTTVDEDSKSEQATKHNAATPVPTAAGSTGATAASTTATETSSQKKITCSDKANDRRYLQCPAAVSVGLLKKFIRMKYGLSDHYRVDLLYNGDRDNNVENELTLLDLSFIFKWKKAEPMCFHYRIFDRSVLKSGLVRPGTKRPSQPSIMDDDKPEDDDGASGARSFALPSGLSSKLPRFGDSSSSSNTTSSSSTSTKNTASKGQGKKSNGSAAVEDLDSVTMSSPRVRRISTEKESTNSTIEVKESQKTDHTSQFNLRITTSPLGSSMTAKLSPSSSTSSSCFSASSPPSPLKISLPLKAIAEGKSAHHHHHHHRKEKKRRRSGKSKDKDRDKLGRDRDKNRERYKYNAHPNPSQSQTISVKPGKHKRSPVGVAVIGKSETSNTANGKKEGKEKEKEKLKTASGTSSDVGTIANKVSVVNGGGENAAAAGIVGLTQRLSISGSSSPTAVSVKANNSISVSKVVERRGSGSLAHVFTFNANSGLKSGPVASASEQPRRPGRPTLASKVLAAGATADRQQGSGSPTARSHIPDSVHLQVPKSVTLIPVNPPGTGGSANSGKLLTLSRLSNEKSSAKVSGLGNPHTFTHPITNKSLHQITVTEVPPPSAKSGSSSSDISSGYSGSSVSSGNSSSVTSGIKSIEKSIQSLSHRQFNGPGSMEITKIYCDTPKSSSSTQPSNCSTTKVFEVQGGKSLKGLDISISPSPAGGVNSNASGKYGGSVRNDSVSVTTTTQKLTVSVSQTLPKIPGVSILPQSNLIGKSGQPVKGFGSGGSQPALMGSMNLKMNEKHSNRRVSQMPQQGGFKNPMSLSLPGDNFSYRTGSEKSSVNSQSAGKSATRKQIGEMTSTALVRKTPSPPHLIQPHHQSKPTFSSVPAKGKIKRPFESTFLRKNNRDGGHVREPPADSSGPSERKRKKINPDVDSPLDLSGKSSRSTPSPAAAAPEDNTKAQSPTLSSCEKNSKGKFVSGPGTFSGLQQGHAGSSSKTGQSMNKSQSNAAQTQTILTIAQNFVQKQHNAESRRERVMMRSKSMNGSSTGGSGQSIRLGGSPPIRNPMAVPTGAADPLGNLMTLSNAAARVEKIGGSPGAASTNSINCLVASSAGYYPQGPSPPAPSTHALAQRFANHHMNMNLMSPLQLKPENGSSFFSNFMAGVGGRGIAVTTASNSLSPPLTNPFVSMNTSRLPSSSASLRIPNIPSKVSPVTSKSTLLFPSLSFSSGKNSVTVSAGGLIPPTKLNGVLPAPNPHPHPHTFLAPSSIPPITKAQSSVKNDIPNSMKISNFLPTTKSTTVSANTNAMITSGRTLAKFLNSIPPTPTIEIRANTSPRPSIPFSIDSSRSSGSGKGIVTSGTCIRSTSTILVSSVSTSAYKLTSLSNSEASSKPPTSPGGKSGANSGSGSGSEGLGALGAALGSYPREPHVVAQTCQQQSGQQNQGVRHIPNPSQIFSSRQNNHSTATTTGSGYATASSTTKSDDENGQVKVKSAAILFCEKSTSSTVATQDSIEVIKPTKPDPLPLQTLLLSSPPLSLSSSSVVEPSPLVTVKETEDAVVRSHEEDEEENEPKREVLGEERQRQNDTSSLLIMPTTPLPQGMGVTESKKYQKPSREDDEKLGEKTVLQTLGDDPLDDTTEIRSELEEEIEKVVIPMPLPKVKLDKVSSTDDAADAADALPVEIQSIESVEKKGTDIDCVQIVESCMEKDTIESRFKETFGESSYTIGISESEIISTTPHAENDLKMDEEDGGRREIADDDSQEEEVTTEDEDEGQLSLEVAQVENKEGGLTTKQISIPTEISTSGDGGKEVEIGSELSESLLPTNVCSLAQAVVEDPVNSKVNLESLQGMQESGPISAVPVTVTAMNKPSTPPAVILSPLQIKLEPVELTQIHLSHQPVEMTPISVSPTSKPEGRHIRPDALKINTNSPGQPLRPKSLSIPSPTLVSSSGSSRSGSPSQGQGLNSPDSGDKKVDLRKMENLEKVAAGLLASAANNINNNNVIVTTAGACDLGRTLTSPPPASPSTINPTTRRSTPPPITITGV